MDHATYLRTADIPLDDLRPFPGNAKRHDLPTIEASLRRNGQFRPLVVRELEDGALVVLAGNGTMEALRRHGPGRCAHQRAYQAARKPKTGHPCALCADGWNQHARCELYRCTDHTAARINLVDNRANELGGGYDSAALAAILQDLGQDYDGTGYTDDDLDGLLEALDADPAHNLLTTPTTTGDGPAGGPPDEADPAGQEGPAGAPDNSALLGLAGVTVGEPDHQVTTGQVWKLGRHHLAVVGVFDGWPTWAPLLTEGAVFLPYPSLLAPFAQRVRDRALVMVQPEPYLAGHLLDKWARVTGTPAELVAA